MRIFFPDILTFDGLFGSKSDILNPRWLLTLFCGSDRGGRRAAAMYSLIVSAKMNGVDPQAWLTDIRARIDLHPVHRLDELLPWNWTPPTAVPSARAA